LGHLLGNRSRRKRAHERQGGPCSVAILCAQPNPCGFGRVLVCRAA
jgi:hypothetical protein